MLVVAYHGDLGPHGHVRFPKLLVKETGTHDTLVRPKERPWETK